MSGRSRGNTINKTICLILCCLLAFTGCAEVADSPAVTVAPESGKDSTAEILAGTEKTPAAAEVETEIETEGRTLLTHALSYQVDLTHDGKPELLTVDELAKEGTVDLEVSVVKGDEVIWSAGLDAQEEITRYGYFLCSIGGSDYLLSYRAYLEEGSYRYITEVFYLTEEGDMVHEDNNMLCFRTDSYEDFPLDSKEITAFSEWINWYLTRSTLLCCRENGEYTYSTAVSQKLYTEEFSELFEGMEEINAAMSLKEKIETVNNLLYRQWFDDGRTAEKALWMPKEFYETAKRIVEASHTYIWMGNEMWADREIWFADYNGNDLQVIRSEDTYTSPLSCNDILYYRAEEGQTVGEVARYMTERLVAEMTVPSNRHTFDVTDYRILTQELYDWEGSLEECWKSYLWESRDTELTMEDHLWSWLGYADEKYGFIPLGTDMWYFTPNGLFSFDGECLDGRTMDELSADRSLVVGDKIALAVEEDPMAVRFVLIRDGDVYRLQRAAAMEKLYPELISNGEE